MISPSDLAIALKAKDTLSLLDVRKPEEYEAGNLSGSPTLRPLRSTVSQAAGYHE